MENSRSNLTGILTSAALTAAVTLALGWPSRVNAVGNEEQVGEQQAALATKTAAPENAALAQNEYKVGDLNVTATLQPSEATPERQVIRLECNNPTQGRIEGVIQVALTRTRGSGGERVMPTPQIAWRQNENVAVEPGATFIREISLPKNISAEVARIDKLRTAAVADPDNSRYPNVYFGATAEAREQPTKYATKKGKAPKHLQQVTNSSKLTASYSPNREFGY